MRLSVFGLGYVGTVSAVCFAADGHYVVGVDINETKVSMVNDGRTPVLEKEIDTLLAEAVATGNLSATINGRNAVLGTDISLICVGTPSDLNGSQDLGYLTRVCNEIGVILRDKDDFHVVMVCSTVLPGTLRETVIPLLEDTSGKTAGLEFGVCVNPEFLREGTAVFDFRNPPKIVIGETDERSGALVARLYADLEAPLIRAPIEVAELVKYADNAWHALKVGFANEIGNIAKRLSIDSHRVMEIFCQDTKLNLSSCYLKPGFAFGGSCLAKDLRALTYTARSLNVEVPILSSIIPSNQLQVVRAVDMVMEAGSKKVGILGFSFKAGTDDLRESPVVELIERLIGKGYELKLFDEIVNLSRLQGANKDYILNAIPHIAGLMVDRIEEVLEGVDTVVIGNRAREFEGILDKLRPGQVMIDLVRIVDQKSEKGRYHGISW